MEINGEINFRGLYKPLFLSCIGTGIMKNLLKYLKGYKMECVLAPIFKLLEAVFELLVPLVIAAIIDVGIEKGDTGYIYKKGALLLIFAFVGLCSAITAQYYSAVLGVGFGTKLRDDLFAHILSFSHREIDILGKNTLITRLTNDTNQIQTGVNLFFRLVLRSPFLVIGAMVMALGINFKIGLIFICIILILYVIVMGIMSISIKLYKKVQTKLDTITGITGNNLAGVRIIRAFNQEKNEYEEFVKASEKLYNEQNTVSKLSALMNPFTYVAVNLGIVLILYSGGLDISVGNLSKGEVIALVNYMAQILVELIKTANLIVLMSKSFASAKRINEIFDIENSLENGKLSYPLKLKNGSELIRFDKVSFRYPGSENEAISDISFTLKKGETLGIIGGTGSGKSTLVNLIPRFYDVSSGSILLNGVNIKEYDIHSLRKSIGTVEQKSKLFEGSIEYNLLWGDENANEELMNEALELAMAKEIVDSKESGLKSHVAATAKNFSGGQKQRLSIARTLVRRPDVLILDDSSSALDYITDAKLRQNIRKLPSSNIIVSQRVASVRNADKILVLDDGIVVGLGKHDVLLDTCKVYEEICLSQLSVEEARIHE